MKLGGGILAGLLLAIMLSGCGVGGSSSAAAPGIDTTLASQDLWPGILNQVFQTTQPACTATVYFVSSTITVTPATPTAAVAVSVNGLAVSSGTATVAIPLAIARKLSSVNVTAEDGASTNSHAHTATRQSEHEFARQACIKASGTGNTDFFGFSAALAADTQRARPGGKAVKSPVPGGPGGCQSVNPVLCAQPDDLLI
jgi:hypothetical protein